MKVLVMAAMAAVTLWAQSTPPTPPPTGSISGRVVDADTGSPISNCTLGLIGRGVEAEVRCDPQGNYKFPEVTPGPHTIQLALASTDTLRRVTLDAGANLTGVNFRVLLAGDISGRVFDENKDPIVALQVHIIMGEYEGGSIHYFTNGMRATTNDRGEYIVHNVPAGRALYVMFEPLKVYPNPVSRTPADPRFRKPAYRPTYYSGVESPQMASMVTLRSGEKRENVDIRILRSPSYCIDGTLFENGLPASLDFKVTDAVTWGPNSATAGGRSGTDGKIRVCDLYSGQFTITALRQGENELFGAATVNIDREDVHNVAVPATSAPTIHGDVAWEATPPDKADTAKFVLDLFSGVTGGLAWGGGRFTPVPFGPFTFTALPMLDFVVTPQFLPAGAFPNAYIKDITYGPSSILHRRLRVSGDLTLHVTVGTNGGFVHASALPGTRILVLPADAPDEAYLSDALIRGVTDPTGNYTSGAVAPGKYHVIATNDSVDPTPEAIANIWRERNRGVEVDVGPRATATTSVLDPISLQIRP